MIETMDMDVGMRIFTKMFRSNERLEYAKIQSYYNQNRDMITSCTCDKFIELVSYEDPNFRKSTCSCDFSVYLNPENDKKFLPSPADHSFLKLCDTDL